MYKVVFLDSATIADGVLIPSPTFAHNWTDFGKTSSNEVFERAIDADFVITNKVQFDKTLLAKLPALKHIAIAATGTNCVDLHAASALGISVSNVPGYATGSASEHVIAMMLSLRRNLLSFQADISAGKWQQSEQFCFYNGPILDVANTTLGLIGTGAIARQVARVAQALGMQVIYHSISGRTEMDGETLVSLNTLLKNADVVSVHCPLTEATNNLIDAPQLALMRQTALLINTARGSIVNLAALHTALLNKQIAGAGIDVAPQEPPLPDAAIMRLNELHNCIVTPHTAWASQQASQVLMNQVVANLEAVAQGKAINIVTQ